MINAMCKLIPRQSQVLLYCYITYLKITQPGTLWLLHIICYKNDQYGVWMLFTMMNESMMIYNSQDIKYPLRDELYSWCMCSSSLYIHSLLPFRTLHEVALYSATSGWCSSRSSTFVCNHGRRGSTGELGLMSLEHRNSFLNLSLQGFAALQHV